MNLLALGTGAIVGIVVAVVIVLAILIWIVAAYNGLAGSKINVEGAFSTIDVYLKKRYDLIPNLVETVKGYAKHESEVLTAVTNARARAQASSTDEEKIAANAQLTRALRSVNIVAEKYPDLKADSNFKSLQNSLQSVEGEIANSRKYYNAIVEVYNKKTVSFPSLIVAKMFGFKAKPFFTVEDEAERQTPKVQF